ncbi:trigger factor [Nesterenkonia aerolata]|uniref:Trigger factor n=1 Tax=Nesterenkonia aerolata TaxID=3074079 RepID=A0ABU2DSR8_9MICC|nr:trigger factor [Nesterenkonia sp. LY-0111]MDR8019548.1 trigger factor [Nesterenkonia sp. LY-0111]
MVKSTVENLNPTRVKLTVEVSAEELEPKIKAAYKSIAEQVQVPGFRKGKVPAPIIDQRIGREYVIQTAINDGLQEFYQQGLAEAEVEPLSRPEVEVDEIPDPKTNEGVLRFSGELDIKPEVELPEYSGLEVEVESRTADDEAVQKQLDELRGRFGTLVDVERPAAKDDFVSIDLVATIDDEQVDSAEGLSYQVGAGTMLEGIDEALEGLSAGEDATFETTLSGGEHSGEAASVKITLQGVKERELPEADDEFAQMASEFDTIDELMEDLRSKAEEEVVVEQGVEARDKVLEKLLSLVEVPVPESVVESQVEQHFSQGGHNAGDDHDTDEHRSEIEEQTREAFRNEIVLDLVAEREEIGVDQNELIEYIVSTASQYGMEPNQFAQMLDQAGQVPMIMGEVRRRKALAKVLELAVVKDTDGNDVDLSSFVTPEGDDEDAEGADAEGVAEEQAEESVEAQEAEMAEAEAPEQDADEHK